MHRHGTSKLYEEHRELLVIIGRIETMIAQPVPPEAHMLAHMRWQLARLLTTHLASEDALVRLPLVDSRNLEIQAALDTYDRDLQKLRADFAEHNFRWSPAAALADWGAYGQAAGRLIQRLRARIEWEEGVIYPMARDTAHISHFIADHDGLPLRQSAH
jgi:hypothetical protein